MKHVLIGQQPSHHYDEGEPLIIRPGSSGARLLSWSGLTETQFLERFSRINLNPRADGEFVASEWREEAINLLELLDGRKVVLLGSAVAEAFSISRDSYDYGHFFDGYHEDRANILWVVIPHPSGKNRLYNDECMVQKAKDVMFYLSRVR